MADEANSSPTAPQQDTTPVVPEPQKTFTQVDLDRIVSDRLNRERSKYADYDDLKSQAGELQKLRESQQSDTEKAINAAKREADKAARDDVTGKFVKRIAASELRAAASGIFTDPDDVVAHFTALDRLGDFVTAAGEVKRDELTKAIDTLKTTKAHWVTGPGAPLTPVRRPAEQLRPGASPVVTQPEDTSYPANWLSANQRAAISSNKT